MSSCGLITFYSRDSLLHKLDPRTKIVLLVGIYMLAFTLEDPVLLTAILIVVITLWLYASIPIKKLGGFFKSIYIFILVMLTMQSICYPGQSVIIRIIPYNLWIGGIGAVTVEGLLFGISMSLRLLVIFLATPLIAYTTSADVLTLGLIALGMPYIIAFIITTSLSLLPIVQNEAAAIMDAQKARAFTKLETGSWREKIMAHIPLVIPLIVGSFRKAQQLAIAMESRAFNASSKRTYLHEIRMSSKDWVTLGITVVTVSMCVFLRVVYGFGAFRM